jgi:hypothetical protein
MERMLWIGMTVVAEFGAALAGDVEMDLVMVEIVVDPLHRLWGQMVPQNGPIAFLGGHTISRLERRTVAVAAVVAVHVDAAAAG